ncbi:WD40-repeat-containing domain protein [Mycena polygramma]|nr:WD40-repeat-containing domain protein [Mycena polygramma]
MGCDFSKSFNVTGPSWVSGLCCVCLGRHPPVIWQHRLIRQIVHLVPSSLIRTYDGHSQPIVCVSQLSTIPPYFLSASLDHTIRIWDATSTSCVRVIACNELLSAAVHSQSHLILSGSTDGVVSAWDYSNGSQLWHIRTGTSAVTSLTIDSASTRFAVGCKDYSVHIYDVRRQEHGIRSLKFDPHDKYVAFCGEELRDVIFVHCVSGEIELKIRHQPMELAFSPQVNMDGVATGVPERLATASGDGTFRLWDLSDPSTYDFQNKEDPDEISPDHEGWITSLAFSFDTSRLATGGDHVDRCIRLWDARTGKHLTALTGHEWGVYSLVFSPDSQLLASGSGDGTARIWNVETFQQLFIFSLSP